MLILKWNKIEIKEIHLKQITDNHIFLYFWSMKFFRKYHKWLGIIITLFILIFSVSGIILNHRNWFSGCNVDRNIMPEQYHYKNWNNASVKGTLRINSDSILIYGAIGIWLTDSSYSHFTDFNQGFSQGMDNRKTNKLFKAGNHLLAGTLFGLYEYNYQLNSWYPIKEMNHEIMDLALKQDTLLVLTRSNLFKSTNLLQYEPIVLPEPEGYNNKVGLFKTLWVIHSGEIYGALGKLLVDFIGLVFIFLSITGVIYFIAPWLIRRKKEKKLPIAGVVKINRFSLKWHNKLGWILIPFLLITTLTGMFLRPPLLIAIFSSNVSKIPYTELDTPNAWFDKLRRIVYDETKNRYSLATIDGLYFVNSDLSGVMIPAQTQPPISVMGVNVFEQINPDQYLIGSFEGLFILDESNELVFDYVEQKTYIPAKRRGAPIGTHMCTGYSRDFSLGTVFFDYNLGAIPLETSESFAPMPEIIKNQPLSLWNVALEFHTARIFDSIIGSFYLLIIPLIGLFTLFVLVSGFIVWYRYYR